MDWMNISGRIIAFIRQYRYVILVVVIGFILMSLPDGRTSGEAPETAVKVQPSSDTQSELELILGQIQGVGKVQVLLTVAAGEQTLYEFNEDRTEAAETDSVRTETIIITDENRAQQGLVQQVIPPVYQGAIVVCQGGDQPSVKLAIVEAVSDVTGLTADKITVLKMK